MARHLNDPHAYVSVAAAHRNDESPGSQSGIACLAQPGNLPFQARKHGSADRR